MKKVLKSLSIKSHFALLAVAAFLLIAGTSFPTLRSSHQANATCSSIADCTNQINAGNAAVADLQNTALSYQDAINQLAGQIQQLQGQIDANTARQNEVEGQIAANQAEIEKEKGILATDVKSMYVDGTPTTIEMLATSKNLSDFVDKQEYRTAVQNKLQDTLKKIAELQAQLQAQQEQIKALLAQQQSEQNQLASAEAQQQSMLAYNESQQAAYNAQTSQNQAKLDQLIAAQRAANNAGVSAGGYYFLHFPGTVQPHNVSVNDYPYANYGFSMSTAACTGPPRSADSVDRWGYCTRQCVSYAAWAVERSGRAAPRYYGNAKDWVAAARADGVQFDAVPQPGDVAISTAGTWGHAMYVEQVSGNQIYVSQYNQQLTGQYSTQWRAWE